MPAKKASFQTSETITEQVVKTNKWECGKVIHRYVGGDETLAFTIEGERENTNLCK